MSGETNLESLLKPHWLELRLLLAGQLRASGQPAGPEAVNELLAETVAEALPKWDQYDPSRRILAWLLGFVTNILRRRPRGQRRECRVYYSDKLEEILVTDPAHRWEQREQIESYLECLSEPDARILRLRYFDELDGTELAEAIGASSENAARLKLTRALQRLRDVAHQLEEN